MIDRDKRMEETKEAQAKNNHSALRKKPIKIAITGGIGSGKSAVCSILREQGYPVFSCDEIYREMQTDPAYLIALEEAFPGVVRAGRLDRARLASVVFRDRKALEKLNALAHPEIMRRLYASMEKYPLSFGEVPLLFESGRQKDFDGVMVVYRPLKDRIESVCARDELSREQVILRMKNQADYEKILKEGHTVIYNDGDIASLREKVSRAVEEIIG